MSLNDTFEVAFLVGNPADDYSMLGPTNLLTCAGDGSRDAGILDVGVCGVLLAADTYDCDLLIRRVVLLTNRWHTIAHIRVYN